MAKQRAPMGVERASPDHEGSGGDSCMSEEALELARLITGAGASALSVMSSTEAVRALMAGTLSVALGVMERADVVDWLQRLAAEVAAGGGKAS